jgi:recombination protein RecR
MFASPIAKLIQQLAKLPGVGEKTAARLAFHILRAAPEDATALAAAIGEVRQKIRFCSICCDLTEADPCAICRDQRRDGALVCVVAQPQDLIAIERAGGYRGRYHVLHGLLSPLDGIGPDDLRVAELVRRLSAGTLAGSPHPPATSSPGQSPAPLTRGGDGAVAEVILATSPSVEGEATAVYLAKLLRPLGVRTTRIATGVPMGGELEYADQATLARAIDGRREM